MDPTIRCPDCGRSNPAGSESCEHCNYPLAGLPAAPKPEEGGAAVPPTAVERPSSGETPILLPPRPRRPPRPRPATSTSTTLWLFFGTVSAVLVIFIAFKGFKENNPSQPIEGSNAQQMQTAEAAQKALAADSNNVGAHIALANVLYDTSNWSDAIVHYRAAVRRDSTQVDALVDLGVCYFNLGDPRHASEMFQLALQRNPGQPVALFNLGIVAERQGSYKEALSYFHRAMNAGGDENLRKAVVDAMQRTIQESGMKAPPLGGTASPESLPPGHPPVGNGK